MQATINSTDNSHQLRGDWKTYNVYGLNLASNFPLRNHLRVSSEQPELRFSCVLTAPQVDDPEVELALKKGQSIFSGADEDCGFKLFRRPTYDLLHFRSSADYYIWEDRIICHLLDEEKIHWVEIGLLGAVLSFWFDRNDSPALHSSAVVVHDQVIAFLAHSFTGKSSLAATFCQAGYPVFTDDVMPVDLNDRVPVGRPGYPQMRLWPDQASHFIGNYEQFDLVHPDYSKRRISLQEDDSSSFCYEPRPLGCLYLPDRREPETWGLDIQITPVSPKEAIRELVRHSFMANLLDAGDLQPQRLHNLAKLAQQIPMRQLIYPSGLEHLPRVRDAVLEDFVAHA